jgi:hypothetical protein
VGTKSHYVPPGSALDKDDHKVSAEWLKETTGQTIDNSIGLCYIGLK